MAFGEKGQGMREAENKQAAFLTLEALLWRITAKEQFDLRLFFDDDAEWPQPAPPTGQRDSACTVRFVRGRATELRKADGFAPVGATDNHWRCWDRALDAGIAREDGGNSLIDFLKAVYAIPHLFAQATWCIGRNLDRQIYAEWSPSATAGENVFTLAVQHDLSLRSRPNIGDA